MDNGGMPLTPLQSESPEPITESEYRVKRAAYASLYYEKCQDLLASASLQNLQAVDQALSKVDQADIDIAEAESLVKHLKPLLSLNDNDAEVVLYACQVIVKLRVRKPESLWMGSADIAEHAASSFRDLSLRLSGIPDADLPLSFVQVVDSWTALVRQGKLEEHLSYPLMTSALQWIFVDRNKSVRTSYVAFISASYSHISPSMQDQILHEVFSVWFRHSVSASQEAAVTIMELILSLVAVAGTVPESTWENAVTMKSRSSLELACQERHSHAVAVANLISRRLIDFTWAAVKSGAQRVGFQKFLVECSKAVLSPQWPSAELFISAFVSSLIKLTVLIRSQKYPGFVFDSLQTLYDSLPELSAPPNSGDESTGNATIKSTAVATSAINANICRAITSCLDEQQALYLASRQCSLPNQPFYDFFDAYNRRAASTSGVGPDRASWLAVLQQYPIASYRGKIAQIAAELTSSENLKEQHQIELFRLTEKVVSDDPQLFRIGWLDRLSYASPAVCDALVPISAKAYRVSKDLEVLRHLCTRISGPGAAQFKKRVLSLLSSVSHDEADAAEKDRGVELMTLAWKHFLIAATDSDEAVRSCALTHARQWFNAQLSPAMADILVRAQSGPDQLLVRRGLRTYIMDYRARSGNGDNRIRKLVDLLLGSDRLDLALAFVEIDGGFTPLPRVPVLFEQATKQTEPIKSLAIRILDSALSARPRLILVPSLANNMFGVLLNGLKTCPESSMDHIGSILGQLITLGNSQTQQHRSRLLCTVINSAVRNAESLRPYVGGGSVAQSQNLVKFHQSVLICGCARFWDLPTDTLRDISLTFIRWVHANDLTSNTKLVLLRVIFRLSIGQGALLNDPVVVAFFDGFEEGSEEYTCLTRLLLKLMLDNDRSRGSPQDLVDNEKKKLFSPGDDMPNRIETGTTLMLQRHVAKLIRLLRKDQDVLVLRVIVKAIEDNLVVADECIPIITSLCFSNHPYMSQTALRSFMMLCERWPRNLGIKFVEGLKTVNVADREKLATSYSPMPFMWRTIKESQKHRNIKPMLEYLAQLFNSHTASGLLELLILGLSQVDMETKDAKFLVLKIEDEVNQVDITSHGQHEVTQLIIVQVFTLWMRNKYGLTDSAKGSMKPAVVPEDSDMERIDYNAIWHRFASPDINAAAALDELWKMPDSYGSKKMNALIYGDSSLGHSNHRNMQSDSIELDQLVKRRKTE